MIRDMEGRIWGASTSHLDIDLEASIAELREIQEGVRIAESMGYGRIIVESDCMLAVNLILKKTEHYWGEVESVVETIWTLI